jgi:riboflavin biosynthesis pyrimidine reductase
MNTEMNKGVEPAKEIEEMYLNENLQGLSDSLGRMVMIGDYVCDEGDGIAVKDAGGAYIGLKNALDWGLFQRLAAQADAIITGSDYLERVKKMGLGKAQNVLNQYSQGEFKFLGDWREEHGMRRNPDVIVVTRSLDLDIPEGLIEGERKFIVFTTHASSKSDKAKELRDAGALIIDAGTKDDAGVDGAKMDEYLDEVANYKVVKITTGPRALKIQLDAKKLDILYITRVHREIPADADNIVRILVDGGKVAERSDLMLARTVKGPVTDLGDGTRAPEDFETYINKNLPTVEKKIILQGLSK